MADASLTPDPNDASRPTSPPTSPIQGDPSGFLRRPSVFQQMMLTAEYDPRERSDATVRARKAVRAAHAADRTAIERLADRLTALSSSAPFLVTHVAWFALWIAANSGVFGLKAFDPFPYGLLTMIVSLEAIILSSLVLMAQNRDMQISELREEMSLQVMLRMEEEQTKSLQIIAALYEHHGYSLEGDDELAEMLKPLDADEIERDMIEQLAASGLKRPHGSNTAAK
jgi:uncharacterized membrane protein